MKHAESSGLHAQSQQISSGFGGGSRYAVSENVMGEGRASFPGVYIVSIPG